MNEDGTVAVTTGHPDIGGSRASMVNITAELLGIHYSNVSAQVGDTNTIGFSATTGGSRVTFSAGTAVTQATGMVVDQLRERARILWEIDTDAVEWNNGHAYPAGPNAGDFEPLSLAEIAAKAPQTGRPDSGQASVNAQGAAPAFATHICDVEVDPETGYVRVIRYTGVQDAGRAIHPGYVEGQIQGGVAQGIGWALNEEYIYDDSGQLENPGFLDYRIPVASDLPMIDTAVVEVPNDAHPQGVRGVGEVPIVPPMAAVANAINDAIGLRFTSCRCRHLRCSRPWMPRTHDGLARTPALRGGESAFAERLARVGPRQPTQYRYDAASRVGAIRCPTAMFRKCR